MPRPRSKPLFEIAGQWIAADPGSPNLYRFWTEPGTGRTRRASLGTADIEHAKIAFAQAVLLKGPKTPDAPLATVLESYFLERTDKLPSRKHARLAGRTLLECWGNTIRCSQLVETKQETFAKWSVSRGHSLGYISRNLSVLAAAIGYAKLPVAVYFGKRQIKERWALQTKAPRKPFIPTDDQLAKFFALDMPPALFRWAVVASLTGARPEAVLDLTPAQRIRDAGLVNLNPAGRPQNKKYRPTVREPKALKGCLDRWEREAKLARPLNLAEELNDTKYCAYVSVDSLQTAMSRAAEKLAFQISVYSFRHKMATILRKARTPKDQIDLQLGHARPEGYGEWNPDYLDLVAKTIDAWWKGIAKKAKGRLNSRATPETAQNRKVRNSHLRAKSRLYLVA